MKKNLLLFIAIFAINILPSSAQWQGKEGLQWVFGDSLWMNFNTPTRHPVLVEGSKLIIEQSLSADNKDYTYISCISDPETSELKFYGNSLYKWSGKHQIILTEESPLIGTQHTSFNLPLFF